MRHARAALRLVTLVVLSVVLFPTGLFTRIVDLCGAHDVALRLSARVQSWWGRAMLFGMGVRVDVQGKFPDGRYLIVANHLSYVDIPVLATAFPGRFIAKSEIAGWPAVGWLARSVGTLFVQQARRKDLLRVGEEMERTLKAGVTVVLFPEGGASRGARVESFHSSLFEGPARLGIPCLDVSLHYETPGVSDGTAWTVCWWGGMGLWRHMWRLLGLPRVQASVRSSAEPRTGERRKELAQDLHAALSEHFRPISQEPVPSDLPWPWLLEAPPEESPARS